MKTKTNIFRSALAAVLLVIATTQSYAAFSYTIGFTASGCATTVGSVQVQNLTQGTTVTVPDGNTLTLTNLTTSVDELNAGAGGIRISQNASAGTSVLTFYASQVGSAQVAAYAFDGREVVGLSTRLDAGDNSLELTLPIGMYVIRVSGAGYSYSAKLHGNTSAATQAGIKFLSHTNVETSIPQKSKEMPLATTTMTYADGDQLLYTATSGTYIASVRDVPTESKTTNFNFATIPTSVIPAGTFTMGSPTAEANRSENEVQHQVELTAFRMSKYEISNAQYAAFLNAKNIGIDGVWSTAPVYTTQILIYANSSMGLTYSNSQWIPVIGYENAPVINVTWYGAAEYATYIGGTLPTEAQWEYACRADTTKAFNTGDFLTNLQANYNWAYPYNNNTKNTVTNSPHMTQAVGVYPANAYGLYDMHGNVDEWCADWYAGYSTTAKTNPTGPVSSTISGHVARGGGWNDYAQYCRSACRRYKIASHYSDCMGFRVVLVP